MHLGFACARGFSETGINSELLLHRVSTGDPAAVREVIDRYSGLIWSLARRLGVPEAEIEDVVNEIFTELWRVGERYDPTIASETAFIATIARRRLIDRRRKLSRHPVRQQLGEDLSVRSSEPRADVGEQAARAEEALTALSSEQQRVLRLSIYEGLSHELIARSTGLPLGTVKTHARRGLIKLRQMLGGGEAEANGDGPAAPENQVAGTAATNPREAASPVFSDSRPVPADGKGSNP